MRKTILCITAVAALAAMALPAVASTPTVTYTGQGFIDNGNGSTIVKDERCGLEGENTADDGGTGQFANWNGPGQPYQTGQGYLVWVLTLNANPAGGVTLHLPDGEHAMVKVGGTWKYASQYDSRDNLVNFPAHATFSGNSARTQLVVSHGCKPFDEEKPAWCSPGFWKNALDPAWEKTGHTKAELFNDTVVPSFYDTPFTSAALPSGPTLNQALDNTGPAGANKYGAASGPYGLNAYNATAAMLTDSLDGYAFSVDAIADDNCPLDHAGNWK
jgi:hypothetical protein